MTIPPSDLHVSQLLHNMVEMEASNLFISAGATIQMRIHGVLQPVTEQPLLPGQTRQLAGQFLSKNQLADFFSWQKS